MTIEGMPWGVWLGVSGTGWSLVALFVWGLFTGKLFVPRREADVYIARAEKAEEGRDTLIATVAEMTAVGKFQKAAIDAAIRASNAEGEST